MALDPNNLPADLTIAVTLLSRTWREHNVPTGAIVGGFLTLDTAQLLAQRRVDALLAQLETAGVHVEMTKESKP